jgi:hypothetical protein
MKLLIIVKPFITNENIAPASDEIKKSHPDQLPDGFVFVIERLKAFFVI